MRRTTSAAVAAAALLTVGVLAPTASASDDSSKKSGSRLEAVGLTSGGTALVSFTTDKANAKHLGAVAGLAGDTKLVGIDYRVQNGKLYGLGEAGGIYTISGTAATKVGQLSVALSGGTYGVDFNPAANALRVVSDNGQNLRQPFPAAVGGVFSDGPAAGAATVVDGALTNPATPPATGTVPATGITGAAYTNNDLDADTSTVLHDLDTALNRLSLQVPANAGTLSPVGNLLVDASTDSGFDIYSTVRDGRTVAVEGFAVSKPANDAAYRLYSINLATGEAADRGSFDKDVTDIAIGLNQR